MEGKKGIALTLGVYLVLIFSTLAGLPVSGIVVTGAVILYFFTEERISINLFLGALGALIIEILIWVLL